MRDGERSSRGDGRDSRDRPALGGTTGSCTRICMWATRPAFCLGLPTKSVLKSQIQPSPHPVHGPNKRVPCFICVRRYKGMSTEACSCGQCASPSPSENEMRSAGEVSEQHMWPSTSRLLHWPDRVLTIQAFDTGHSRMRFQLIPSFVPYRVAFQRYRAQVHLTDW